MQKNPPKTHREEGEKEFFSSCLCVLYPKSVVAGLPPAGGAVSLQAVCVCLCACVFLCRLKSLKSTRLVFAVRHGGGGHLVEKHVGVTAADLTGGHRTHPAHTHTEVL